MTDTDALVEKVARAICVAHGVDPDSHGPERRHVVEKDGLPTIMTDHLGPLWRLWSLEALAALTALGLHEGKNCVVDAGAIPAIVRDSMQAAWDDICADTDCYPLDLRKRRGKLYFVPDQWARQAGELAQSSMVNARPEQSNG